MMNNVDIVIFNQFISADRREAYIPTSIYGVSWYSINSLSRNDRTAEAASKVVIRIPYNAQVQNGRTYVKENVFRKLDYEQKLLHWTIQKNSYVAIYEDANSASSYSFKSFDEIIKYNEICPEDMSRIINDNDDFYFVTEYADNTKRGSDTVKHWRVEGSQ